MLCSSKSVRRPNRKRLTLHLVVTHILLFTAFSLSLHAGVKLSSEEEPGSLYILTIGVNKGDNPRFSPLAFAVSDAESIAKELSERGKYHFSSVKVVTLTDEHASEGGIVGALDTIARTAEADDTVVFAYSGHGESFDNEFYLFPADQTFNASGVPLREKSISNTYLQAMLRKIRARQKLVFIDACNFKPNESSLFEPSGASLAKDYLLIASRDIAFDLTASRHGALTTIFLKGLMGAADLDGDGFVSTLELQAYMYSGPFLLQKEFSFPLTERVRPKVFAQGNFKIVEAGEVLKESQRVARLQEQLKSIKDRLATVESAGSAQQLVREEVVADTLRTFLSKPAGITDEDRGRIPQILGVPPASLEYINLEAGKGKVLKAKAEDALQRTEKTIAELRASSDATVTELLKLRDQGHAIYTQIVAGGGEDDPMRAGPIGGKKVKVAEKRTGKDYALFFANFEFDHPDSWRALANPLNDVTDIASVLTEKYGFDPENVVVKVNQTTREINQTIREYTDEKKFSSVAGDDSQLFIYFAGHGVGSDAGKGAVKGYFVGRDSPEFSEEESGKFVRLDDMLGDIDGSPFKHIFVVYDACFAGLVWKPSIRLEKYASNSAIVRRDDLLAAIHPSEFISTLKALTNPKERMGNRTRMAMASGDVEVPDAKREATGELTKHSPFAEQFLAALRSDEKDKVLESGEICYKFMRDLNPLPLWGRFGGDGDFVFIAK